MYEILKKIKEKVVVLFCVSILLFLIFSFFGFFGGTSLSKIKNIFVSFNNDKYINVLSSYENRYLEEDIQNYAKENKIKVKFNYLGDLDIVDELNHNSANYDAVWISNSIWLYMLENSYLTSESKSISISPVVIGIKKSKAEELGLINRELYNNDILNLIKDKKINYVMSSVTQTNTGATAYLGFLNSLAGSPEVLTEEMLDNEALINDMKNLFSGVKRVSGDESYLETMFLNSDEYEAIISSESSLININKELKNSNKEQLYLIYPKDGVPINDSTFAFIDNNENKKEKFLKLQSYLLSDEGQKLLKESGRRTWYGGVSTNVDNNIFNKDWGIDTNKYLITTKYPSKKVMTKAINLYIEELRKPTHVVFCLDYSGSMEGAGVDELRNAMNYILDYNEASKDKLQFSKGDKITVIPFSSDVIATWSTNNGKETNDLINHINSEYPGGSTALYNAIVKGFEILEQDDDTYTKTVIAMTDGEVNVGSIYGVQNKYNFLKEKIPVYSITFGKAKLSQLEEIASITNAKVFDGKTDLLKAFKEVRGYN